MSGIVVSLFSAGVQHPGGALAVGTSSVVRAVTCVTRFLPLLLALAAYYPRGFTHCSPLRSIPTYVVVFTSL